MCLTQDEQLLIKYFTSLFGNNNGPIFSDFSARIDSICFLASKLLFTLDSFGRFFACLQVCI